MRSWLETTAPQDVHGHVVREIPAWSTAVAGLVVVAGILHLTVLQDHLAEARGAGLFFLAIGALQVIWGARFLLRPSARAAALGLAALAIAPAVLWFITRIFRSPWSGGPEAMDTLGVATMSLEVLAAVILVAARLGRSSAPSPTVRRAAIVLVLTGVLLGVGGYASAMAAEATVPWLGEPDVGHAHGSMPETESMPPTSDGHAHEH
ncbi:MAG: hypothetical protein AABX89_07565 [Candidatus Thermoplasmatota archaeon]